MIKQETKAGKHTVTFILPQEDPQGRVSVVGDFNDWTPGVHTLVKRSNGTRSVKISLDKGESYRFRYLGENGLWFDDPHADRDADANGVVLV